MKICIYNNYLSTMGGGERHSLCIGEYLSKKYGYEVDILSSGPVDFEKLQEVLNIDLSLCSLKVHEEMPDTFFEDLSESYDLFVNACHLSPIKSRAKKNVYLCYFPAKLNISTRIRLKDTAYKIFDKHFPNWVNNWLSHGFYQDERSKYLIGNWTLPKFDIWIAKPLKKLYISHYNIRKSKNERKVHVSCNGTPLPSQWEKKALTVDLSSLKDEHGFKLHFDVDPVIPAVELEDSVDTRKLGLFVTCLSPRRLCKFQLFFANRSIRRLQNFKRSKMDLERGEMFYQKYDLLLANSRYTKGWIKKYWNMESRIFYPPIDVNLFQNGIKENIILGVGRFFPKEHNKKQLELVDCFKQMHNSGLKNWQLHLCGGVDFDRDSCAEYFRLVEKKAVGYPVFLHPNIPFTKLLDLYSRAKLFWHASGLGENEQKKPERFEHFGITTVEALAAGCLPIVINKAGQKEVVENGVNGYLWNTTEEMKKITLQCINEELPIPNSSTLISSAKKYSKENFENNVDSILKSLGLKTQDTNVHKILS